MEPAPRQSPNPLTAGTMLAATVVFCIGVGALIGWALGSTGIGIALGAVVGIPLAVVVVYVIYRDTQTC